MDFKNKPILAMIHLGGSEPVKRALKEIEILDSEGVDGIILENYHGDITDISATLREISSTNMLVGINILPNEYHMAIPMADTYGADFVQLDHVGGTYNHFGTIDMESYLKVRGNFPDVKVLGGIWPKYYYPVSGSVLTDDLKVGMESADAIVVTGSGTGKETPLDKIKEFRTHIDNFPLIIGAGLNPLNVTEQLVVADGGIVGSCLKPYGRTKEMISRDLVKEFMLEVNKVR